MSITIPFDNSYARLPEAFYASLPPTPVRAPRLIAFNADLARIMGIDEGDAETLAQVFSGNACPRARPRWRSCIPATSSGSTTRNWATGARSFWGKPWAPTGCAATSSSRGRGARPIRAWAMAGPGSGRCCANTCCPRRCTRSAFPRRARWPPWTRREDVIRETVLPGAVLTRVASSHLRVGSFQVFAARGEVDRLADLTRYAIDRHYPDADGPMGLLRAVRDAQARLVAQWMAVGFIHGVMNTDNCAISGETIDYGPCAFMDTYHPDTVFSSHRPVRALRLFQPAPTSSCGTSRNWPPR
jgi:hypothetical protein